MAPLVLGDALTALGLPGWTALVASILVAVWHGRSLLQWLSTLGFITRVAGGVLTLVVIVAIAPVPGIDLDPAAFLGWVAGVVGWLINLAGGVA
jgi:hypothetical protein